MKQEVYPMMELDMKNCLPQRPRQRTAEAGLTSDATPRKYGILVVDDDREVRSLLKKGLQGQGLDVWLACDGQQALELFWRYREMIDLVLLDVCMPGLDGPQTALALLQLQPQIRLCFMSGDLGVYTNRKLRDLGALAVIPKPFRLAEIAAMLWELAARADLSPAAV
jgi:CheY-like chemotaxis protein